jgi:hypothetical protein
MKILLIRPPYTRLRGAGQAPYFPLGLGYVGAALADAGHQVRLYDADNRAAGERSVATDQDSVFLSRSASSRAYQEALDQDLHPVWEEVRQVLRREQPDLVGLSVLTVEAGSALKISRLARETAGAKVVWGGVHPTFCSDWVLGTGQVDFAVLGEGEQTVVELAGALERGESVAAIAGVAGAGRKTREGCAERPLIPELDGIPSPARAESLFPERYPPEAFGSIIASRGCPWRCSFCSSREFWAKKVRFRSAESVVEEVRRLRQDHGVRAFTFWDDAFTMVRERVETLCEAIIDSGMRISFRTATRLDLIDPPLLQLLSRAGCAQLELGVETGSQRLCALINKEIDLEQVGPSIKMIRRAGIGAGAFFMAGFPQEQLEDLRATFALMKSLDADDLVLNVFDPMPGSELFRLTQQLGLVPEKPDYADFPLWPEAHFAPEIPREVFDREIEEISRWVFAHNRSLKALVRRGRAILRSGPTVFLKKGLAYAGRRLGLSGRRPAAGGSQRP